MRRTWLSTLTEASMTTTRVGFLAFPNMTQLDMTGPLQVFASLPGVELHVIWKTLDPIDAHGGLRLLPDTAMADCPALDVICVPGGSGVAALMEDESVLAFLQQQAATARYVGSICTGALVLGAAGLLKSRKATTHWAWLDLLAPLGAIPQTDRVVRDGNVFTGGGVTAGIDFALTMVAELAGRDAAEAIQLGIEYAPAPPFDSGRPDRARPEVLAAVQQRMAAMRADRDRVVSRVRAKLAA
jgi:cyclohexyl-isocyanide hydratase